MTTTAPSATRRAGMTLVELLVVVAIIGLLAVAVLPSLANVTEGRRTKETARTITSFIAQCQVKALGQPTFSGFGLIKTSSSAAAPAIDLVPARVPDAYRGDSLTATASFAAGTVSFVGATLASCTTGDLIRFNGGGPWYEFNPTSGTSAGISLRSAATVDVLAGQTAANTPWPDTAPQPFEILRQPKRSGAAFTLGEGRCVDTYWSSLGQSTTAYVGLNSSIATNNVLYVLFDATGQVRQVAAGANRFTPDGPVLLLVGRVDRAGENPVIPLSSDDTQGANWQYPDSIWVAIDQASGICRAAACDATAAAKTPPGGVADPIAWRVRESQSFIFAEMRGEGL